MLVLVLQRISAHNFPLMRPLTALPCFLIALATLAVAQTGTTKSIQQPPVTLTDPSVVISKQKSDVEPISIEKIYTTRQIGGSSWSPDGTRVAVITNISGRANVWIVPASGGWPKQLTVSEQRQIDPVWSPDGNWIAFSSDHGGNEQWDIFLVSPKNGEVINLTNTPEVSEIDARWSPDSKMLAFRSKPRNAAPYDIQIMNVHTRKISAITQGTPAGLDNSDPIWSPDGKQLAYTRGDSGGHSSDVYVADIASGRSTNVTQHEGDKLFQGTDWSPDGRSILLTSNAANGSLSIGLLTIASRKITWLTTDQWESSNGHFSPDGKHAVWETNVDGNTDLIMCDLASHQKQTLPLRKGVNTLAGGSKPFSADGSRLLFDHNGAESPNDVWVYSPRLSKSQRLTDSFVGGLREEDMVQPSLIHYQSTDGKLRISAFAYMPYNLKKDARNPAVVMVHGGPTGQSVNSFNRLVQYLANQGYVVIAPNFRGSSGFGTEFQYANRRDWGGGDLQDVVAAADWLKKTGYVDPKKLVIMGASYGGYMTMMGLTKTPEIWAAGVSIVPFVSLFTEFQNEDAGLREYDRFFMGDPEKNRALWEDRSPINFVGNIKAPLLLIAGGNDPRDPPTEAIQVADRVKANGGNVEIKIYQDEGHGFSRLENIIDEANRIAAFLKKYVPPEAAAQRP
jgi:dipeptidyl aminopeptidase/acylaminoacyl peptidase